MADLCVVALASTRGMSKQGGTRGSDWDGMNLVEIEEHQVRDLVFAQVQYNIGSPPPAASKNDVLKFLSVNTIVIAKIYLGLRDIIS